jgi:hypothetical protein
MSLLHETPLAGSIQCQIKICSILQKISQTAVEHAVELRLNSSSAELSAFLTFMEPSSLIINPLSWPGFSVTGRKAIENYDLENFVISRFSFANLQ